MANGDGLSKQIIMWILGVLFVLVQGLAGFLLSRIYTKVDNVEREQIQLRIDLQNGIFTDSLSSLARHTLELRIEKCETEIATLKSQSP